MRIDGPSRMVKRPTGSGGEPSSPNCGASAGVGLVNLFLSDDQPQASGRHPQLKQFFVLSSRTLHWLKGYLGSKPEPTPEQRAKDLIAAIDAGGLPLNAARVNDIARQLGLEVSTKAPMPETIERIRQALQRT